MNFERGPAWLLNQLGGTALELTLKERLVNRRYSERIDNSVADNDPRLHLAAETIEISLQEGRDRITRIEDKARGTLVGITIAVSVVGASIGMFAKDGVFDNRGALAWIAAVVLVLGLGYFLLSGLLALSAYAVSPLHTPDLADRPEARGASSTDTVAADDDSSWRMTLLDCLDLNVFVAMNKSNRFSASIKLLRNGLASIFFFACLAIYSAVIQ